MNLFSWVVVLNNGLKIFSKPHCKQICHHPGFVFPFIKHRKSWFCIILSFLINLYFNVILFILLYSRFLLVINFIHISVYMSIPVAQFITPPPPPPAASPLGVHTFVLYICVSISSLQTGSSLPFSRFHIYVLIYDACCSLSDLFHSVWQSLDASTSLQITQFRSFLCWVIFHCI